jgi:hypothetical protein
MINKVKRLKLIFALILIPLLGGVIYSQSITGTLGTGGVFSIKDGTTNYLTLSQTTGQVNILRTLRLENTTGASVGVIYMGTNRFLHNYGTFNIFLGVNSGNFTMTGLGGNSAFGYASLSFNTTGNWNSAFGNGSLNSNTTGNNNTAIG